MRRKRTVYRYTSRLQSTFTGDEPAQERGEREKQDGDGRSGGDGSGEAASRNFDCFIPDDCFIPEHADDPHAHPSRPSGPGAAARSLCPRLRGSQRQATGASRYANNDYIRAQKEMKQSKSAT